MGNDEYLRLKHLYCSNRCNLGNKFDEEGRGQMLKRKIFKGIIILAVAGFIIPTVQLPMSKKALAKRLGIQSYYVEKVIILKPLSKVRRGVLQIIDHNNLLITA